MFPFPFRKKKRQKPSKEGVSLLASILVCYEEITKVSYEPENATIRLTFSIEESLTHAQFQKIGKLLAESIAAYLDLTGLHARDELSLVADILYDAFPETLLLDERDPLDPNFEVEQENLLDHMLGTVRQQRLHEKLLGIREGDRVVVYNQ